MSTSSTPGHVGKAQQDQWKHAGAEAAALKIADGMIVGLGSGSTAELAVDAIGRRVAQGLRIVGIPTSEKTAAQARALNIPLSTLAEQPRLDMVVDGADEVETSALNLIKGGGGNLLREKIVASATGRLLIVADKTKVVSQLGAHPLPVEVVPFAWESTARRLAELAGNPVLRTNPDGTPYITDGGHYILDCAFGSIPSPALLASQLDGTVGVVEHGLFIGMTWHVLVAGPSGVETLTR